METLADRYYTQNQASEVLGLTRQTVNKIVRELNLTVIYTGRVKLLERRQITRLAAMRSALPGSTITATTFWRKEN